MIGPRISHSAAGNDVIAAEAGYLRARLYQLHYATPDFARAAELYRELAARQPQSHWAQLGLVKLAMLKLYLLPDSTAPDADRLLGQALVEAGLTARPAGGALIEVEGRDVTPRSSTYL